MKHSGRGKSIDGRMMKRKVGVRVRKNAEEEGE
jgi:hypothetical protein